MKRLAIVLLATGTARTLVNDTTGENDLVWGAGLGCHGIVHVLLEPVAGLPPALAREKLLTVYETLERPLIDVLAQSILERMKHQTRASLSFGLSQRVIAHDVCRHHRQPGCHRLDRAQAEIARVRASRLGKRRANNPSIWRCVCGETVPLHFEQCWNCQTDRPS
mgnify:CR=1 FL=1